MVLQTSDYWSQKADELRELRYLESLIIELIESRSFTVKRRLPNSNGFDEDKILVSRDALQILHFEMSKRGKISSSWNPCGRR